MRLDVQCHNFPALSPPTTSTPLDLNATKPAVPATVTQLMPNRLFQLVITLLTSPEQYDKKQVQRRTLRSVVVQVAQQPSISLHLNSHNHYTVVSDMFETNNQRCIALSKVSYLTMHLEGCLHFHTSKSTSAGVHALCTHIDYWKYFISQV